MQDSYLYGLIERYQAATFTVTRRVHSELRAHLGDDLTLEQYSILRYIRGKPSTTSTELAEVFDVGKSAITSIITKLADKAMLIRIPDDSDRRVIRLTLTEAGSNAARRTDEWIVHWLSGYLKHFSLEEVEAFIQSFERLAALITTDERGSERS